MNVSVPLLSTAVLTVAIVMYWLLSPNPTTSNETLTTFITKDSGQASHKLLVIGNEIWIPIADRHSILIWYKNDTSRYITFPEIHNMYPRDLKLVSNDEIILASDLGLFAMTTEGIIKYRIYTGMFKDIEVESGDTLKAFDHQKNKMITCSHSKHNKWQAYSTNNNVFSNLLTESFPDANSRLKSSKLQSNFVETAVKFSIINGFLWIPIINKRKIQIWNSDGTNNVEVQFRKHGHLQPRALQQVNKTEILMACDSGLFVINKVGQVQYEITDGQFNDISMINEHIVIATEYQNGIVYRLIFESNTWKAIKQSCDKGGLYEESSCSKPTNNNDKTKNNDDKPRNNADKTKNDDDKPSFAHGRRTSKSSDFETPTDSKKDNRKKEKRSKTAGNTGKTDTKTGENDSKFGKYGATSSDDKTIDTEDNIEVHSDLSMLVADTGKHNIIQFSSDAKYYTSLPIDLDTEKDQPVYIAVDPKEHLMFWTNVKAKTIFKATLNGDQQEVIVKLPIGTSLEGIALDLTEKYLFYVDSGMKSIYRTNYHGTEIVPVVKKGLSYPRAIVAYNKFIYWTDCGVIPNIMKANYKDPNTIKLAYGSTLGQPSGLTLDTSDDTLYWCDGRLGRIESMKMDGTNRKLLSSDYGQHYFSITLLADFIYVTNLDESSLQRIHKTGGKVENVGATALSKPYGIAIANSWKSPEKYAVERKLSEPQKPEDVEDLGVLITSPSRIYEVDFKLSSLVAIPVKLDILESPRFIAVDESEYLMFWIDTENNNIVKSSINGEHKMDVVLLQDDSVPEAMVVDTKNKLMFYTDSGKYIVGCTDYNGAHHIMVVDNRLDLIKPKAVTVDPDNRMIYWSEVGTVSRIMKMTYKLKDETVLVKDESIGLPLALTLDISEQTLYWFNENGKIESMNTDGSNRRILKTNKESYCGITLFGDYMYLTATKKRELHQVHKYDAGLSRQIYQATSTRPYGITSFNKTLAQKTRQLQQTSTPMDMLVADFDDGTISQVDTNTHAMLSIPVTDINSPVVIDVDNQEKLMFWFDSLTNTISRSTLMGDNQTVVKTLPKNSKSHGIAVDWISRMVFYTETGTSLIKSINYEGSNEHIIVQDDLDRPAGIVLHILDRQIYWTDMGSYPNIATATYHGTHQRVIVDGKNIGLPTGLALDTTDLTLYWCDMIYGNIESIKTDGTGRKLLASEDTATYFGIALLGEFLYVTDSKSRYLKRVHRSGGVVTKVGKPVMTQPSGIVAVNKTTAVTYTMDHKPMKSMSMLVADASQQKLLHLNIDSYEASYINVGELSRPVAIDIDTTEMMVFWTDVSLKLISKGHIYRDEDTTVIKQLPKDAIPDGIAVDWKIKMVFYTDTGRNLIAKMDYDGDNENFIIEYGLDEPRAIVLDMDKRTIYLTDWGKNPMIMTANYRGLKKMPLVNSNLLWPNGLTLDTKEILYWCDGKLGRLESIRTDGTGRKLLASDKGARFFGITLIGDFLHLTDWNSRYVRRINKHGGSFEQVGRPVVWKGHGVVAFNRTEHTVI